MQNSPDGHYKAISGKLFLIGYEPDGEILFALRQITSQILSRSTDPYKLKPRRHRSAQIRWNRRTPELHYRGYRGRNTCAEIKTKTTKNIELLSSFFLFHFWHEYDGRKCNENIRICIIFCGGHNSSTMLARRFTTSLSKRT